MNTFSSNTISSKNRYNLTPPKSKATNPLYRVIENFMFFLDNNVTTLNNSKLFAGMMIIVLNVSSKFVTFKLSKTMESYLKYTFSRNILVFAISWMGTRDIYIAAFITLIYIIFIDYLLNEESAFCCLPKHFTQYHVELLENMNNTEVTLEEYKKAKDVVRTYRIQQTQKQTTSSETGATAEKDVVDDNSSEIDENENEYKNFFFTAGNMYKDIDVLPSNSNTGLFP